MPTRKPATKLDKPITYTLDLSACVDDDDAIVDAAELRNYIASKLKLDGKPIAVKPAEGEEADADISIDARSGVSVDAGVNVVSVTSKLALSKRYLKYLSKKYIASIDMRDCLHVVASGKTAYAIKPYKAAAAAEE